MVLDRQLWSGAAPSLCLYPANQGLNSLGTCPLAAPLRLRLSLRDGDMHDLLLVPAVEQAFEEPPLCRAANVPLPDGMQMYNLLLHLGVQNVFQPGFLARI